jgi:hypothetical protein
MRLPIRNHSAALLLVLALATLANVQTLPPGFPREGATRILENDRVIIWDATWHKGNPTPLHEHPVEYLSVTLVQGTVKVTDRDGKSNTASVPLGFVRFNPKGVVHIEEGISNQERRAIMVELKDSVARSAGTTYTVPAMFPREGAKQLVDNNRVTVWDATWAHGRRIGSYEQRHDTVIVFLHDGTIGMGQDGKVSDVRRSFGDVVYSPAGGGARSEEARDDGVRAVFIELK